MFSWHRKYMLDEEGIQLHKLKRISYISNKESLKSMGHLRNVKDIKKEIIMYNVWGNIILLNSYVNLKFSSESYNIFTIKTCFFF
jgi:hypothetical protein